MSRLTKAERESLKGSGEKARLTKADLKLLSSYEIAEVNDDGMTVVTQKPCVTCGYAKPVDEFRLVKRRGRLQTCVSCEKASDTRRHRQAKVAKRLKKEAEMASP